MPQNISDQQIQQFIQQYKDQPGAIARRWDQVGSAVSPEQFVRAAGGIGYTPQQIGSYFSNQANMGNQRAPAGLMQYLSSLS